MSALQSSVIAIGPRPDDPLLLMWFAYGFSFLFTAYHATMGSEAPISATKSSVPFLVHFATDLCSSMFGGMYALVYHRGTPCASQIYRFIQNPPYLRHRMASLAWSTSTEQGSASTNGGFWTGSRLFKCSTYTVGLQPLEDLSDCHLCIVTAFEMHSFSAQHEF